MKKEEKAPHQFNSLSDAHRALGLPQPKHPLISLINNTTPRTEINQPSYAHVLNFYKISYRPKLSGKIKYGQGHYDFDEGGLLFAAPNQVIGSNNDENGMRECSLYALLIHPDFLWNYP